MWSMNYRIFNFPSTGDHMWLFLNPNLIFIKINARILHGINTNSGIVTLDTCIVFVIDLSTLIRMINEI